MYVLHYAPDNASMIVRLVLEEAGLPYETALVNRAARHQDRPAYRALNPTGLIPVLETPMGPIAETGAILLWLADTHGLGPKPDSAMRPVFLNLLFFLSNTAHSDLRQLFYPEQYVPREATSGHFDIIRQRMQRNFAILDAAFARHSVLFAPGSVLAAYTLALARWAVLYPEGNGGWFDITAFPALKDLAHAQETLARIGRVAQAEGLGTTPFTAPNPAAPAEGSVM